MELPIYLVGYMGAGKTTAGRLLAEKLGWHFVDLDDAFAQIHGYTTAEYIRTFGIEEFRKKEKYVVEGAFHTKYSAKQYYDFLQEIGTINRNHRFIIEVDDNGKVSKIK